MRTLVAVLISLVGFGLVGGNSTQQGDQRLGDYIQQYALDLSSVTQNEPANMVVSPLSITTLLSQLLLGASGSTKDQLRAALLYPEDVNENSVHNSYRNLLHLLIQDKPGLIVNIANRLFVDGNTEIRQNFFENIQHYYRSNIQGVNFSEPTVAKEVINSWVSNETRGKIPRLLGSVHPQTSVLAVNAVYFKGSWKSPFDKMNTKPGLFKTFNGNITVPMMSGIFEILYTAVPEINAEIIGLPYEGDQFVMYIVLPKEPVTKHSLKRMMLQLDPQALNRYIANMSPLFYNIFLPRMTLNFKADLSTILKEQGVTDLFNRNLADLSNMTPGHKWVDNIIHETVIDITEAGTEAAAATAATISRFGSSRVARVDRPFVMIIREEANGVPLFWGQVTEPKPLLD